MTQLGVADTQVVRLDAGGLVSKIKWSVVVPWAVSMLIVGTNGYHRFLSVEESRQSDAADIAQLRKDVTDLKQQVSVLVAIVERIEAQQSADVLYNGQQQRRRVR